VLHLLSLGSYLMLRCLRLLLQDLTFHRSEPMETRPISAIVRMRLSTSLATFTSASVARKFHDRVEKASMDIEEREKVFLALSSTSLLLESSALWGECAPYLMPSQELLDQQLRRLFEITFSEDRQENMGSYTGIGQQASVREDVNFPWCDIDENLLKLDSLCRRLRSTDMLDMCVPRPCMKASSVSVDSLRSPSAILAFLSNTVLKGLDCSRCIANNIEGYYHALCHRSNTQLLLWDGFCRPSSDDSVDMTFARRAKHDGEVIEVGSKLCVVKDPGLVFDAAKCADSMAIVSPGSTDTRSCSVNQRANKVWGTVLSSKCFKPKSGVHRWAVKMDKCERGLIFVGVGLELLQRPTSVGINMVGV
jgi:hypothetical protein